MRDYRKLKVFHKADQLAADVYRATEVFPKSEIFELAGQMRRAALSVPVNIVQGSVKDSLSDYGRFLNTSLGSLKELGYYLRLAFKMGLLPKDKAAELAAQEKELTGGLIGLIRSLKKLKD